MIRLGVGPALRAAGRSALEHAERVLTDALGAGPVSIMVLPTYAALMAKHDSGDVDLAWLPPVLCVRALDRGAPLALACLRGGGKSFNGALFVRAGSTLHAPEDLRGTRVAWVDKDSCSGYLFPRLALAERGIDLAAFFSQERVCGSHAAVASAVERGDVECGATFYNTLHDGTTQTGWSKTPGAESMRVVLISAAIPSDALCIGAKVDEPLLDRLTAVLPELHATPEGATVLDELFDARRLEIAAPADYDVMRQALGLRSRR